MKYKLLRFSLLSILAMLWGGFIPLWATEATGTITFGTNNVKINSSSVTGDDSQGNTWTITTEGTTSFTTNATYYQVGSSSKPATSITFTTTLPQAVNVKSISAKFGGFSGTAGSVTLKVDETSVGTGQLNGTSDVTVSSTISGTGTVLTVSVTGIAKGVKCYNISYTYDDPLTATTLTLGDHQELVCVGQSVDLPTATVAADGTPVSGAEVTWSSSDESVAKIEGQTIKGLAEGTTTIKAVYAGDATYASSVATYEVKVEEALTNPYTYTFEKKIFEQTLQTEKLKAVNWTVETNGGYWGYDGTKGQQFGSGNNPATTLILKTSDILGTITNVKINASGANGIAATVGVTVGGTAMNYGTETTASLTATATDYEFTGSASGEIIISYSQTSSVAIYIKSIEVTYSTEEPAGFRDIKADLTSTTLIPEGAAQWDNVSTGISVAADGSLSRIDKTGADIVFNGKWHGTQYGWAGFTATVPVEGCVKITYGNSNFGSEVTVTDSEGATVAKLNNKAGNTWSATNPDLVTVAYYRTNEPTTLNFSKCDYVGYFAVEAIDEADLPAEVTTYNVTFAAGDGTGVAPAAVEVDAGESVTIPANTTLYKEGYTLTAWTDGSTDYTAGQQVTVSEDMTLTPVFTENTVTFADRTAETTLVWQFGEKNGAGTLNAQGKKTILVTQATIGEAVIDVKMDIDATNGKINNVGRGDQWAQCNDGTILTIPAYKGTAVSFDSYSDATGTTIGGADAVNKAATYDGTAETLDILAKGMGYIASVTAVYPVPAAEEEKFVDIKADFTKGSFFTAEETNITTAGLKMNENGSFTRVAADDATANAVITGKYHSDQHGLANFSATVKVLGTVKVSMGSCAWGGDVTVKNAEGQTVATFNTNNGACWSNSKPEENVLFAYYKVNEPTTLTISGGSYTPYFAVEAVSPELIPNDVKFVFDIAGAGAEGVAPETETVAIGKNYTLPKNFTLYKEGSTLTGWTDGTNTYAPGDTIVAPEAETITLTPVFTENTVSLADRTEPVTLKYNFRRDQGAPTVGYQNQTGIWVAQATINGKTIDVKADFDTNNGGKFANGNWNDWAQLNGGTKFTVPSCKGATVSMEAYSEITTTTIDGQTDYTSGNTISYTIAGSAETVDVVIGDGSYYRYIQVVLPVVQSQGGGENYDNEEATVVWPFTDSNNMSAYTSTPDGVFSTIAANTGDITLNGTGTGQATYPDGSAVSFVKLRPAGNTQTVEWSVKPAAGLTFTPTKISAYIARFGTDAENGITITAKAGEGETITLGNFTAPRNNKTQAEDKYGKNSNYTNQFIIELTAEQQAALASADGLSVFGTVGVASGKDGGYAEMTIEGLISGTAASVNKYTLATAVAPEEAGSINVYPAAEEYEEGSAVKLTATENFGYDFVNWTDADGEVVSTDPVYTFEIAKDETLTANFKAVETYELALTVDGTNDYMVTVSPAPTVVDGKMMYEAGTAVQLTANQYEGLVTFTNWSDGETNSSKLISMTENTEITAMYAQSDIIAGWDFYKSGGDGRKADFYAEDNDADALSLVNTEDGTTSGWLDKSTEAAGGYESFKGAAVNWRTGTSNGDVGNYHWQTKVNAEAFTDIKVQFQMLYNYNAYQKYDTEYSLDGESWTKFGSITMSGAKAEASFSEQLPAGANNQKDLYIRMKADKTSKVDGTASANDGNTLAMFFITGTPKLVNDGKAPVLVSNVPADNATGVSASGKIVLTFDERVKVAEGTKATLGTVELTPTVSGKTVTFEYKGLEYSTDYTFALPGNSIADLTDNFITEAISLTFTTMERPSVTKGLYDAVVGNVDELMAAINAAEARSDKNVRYRIFVKNGNYTIPLSSTMKTVNGYEVPECITFIRSGNISFIGESRDGVIITNGIDKNETFAGTYGTTSKYDGIGNSDVFQISGSDYYFQDLTIESGMDDATGRGLAVQDKATRTIYKNTGLRGYQDTWTSNNDNGLYYFEGGYVRGRTDYMCGKGDAFFNGVELRQIAGGYAAVPSKSIKYGYVYKDCVINGEGAVVDFANQTYRSAAQVDGNYTLGRPWGSGTPVALFIDTKMNVVPSAIGWNEMSGGWPKRFAEYNSTTSTGSQIDLNGRKKTFGDGHENNPVLTAEEALEAGNLHNMFGEWDPTLQTEQAPLPKNVALTGSTLTWDDSNYALLWAVVKDGAVIDFTTEPQYIVDDPSATYAVRAANEMGGLSEASAEVTGAVTVDVTVTIPASGYATLASDKALDFTGIEGLTAYIVSAKSENTATLTAVDAAPAGTGLVLKGTGGSSYTISVAETEPAAITNNLLIGAVGGAEVTASSVYVLDGGMFKVFSGTQILPGKAYLPKTTGDARQLELVFDGEATGIAGATDLMGSGNAGNEVYNLNGQRVRGAAKGIYIMRGKKVIVK